MKRQFSGTKLNFSYMTGADLHFVSGMLEKESVCEWLFFGPNTPEETKSYFDPLISGMEKDIGEERLPSAPVFTINDKKTGHFVGQCALLPVDFSEGAYLIGYQLDDICRRRGFGTEACRFLVYYAFCVAGGYRLNGDCVLDNTASWRIMEKCGFKWEGLQRSYWNHNGRYYDRVLYGLLLGDLDAEMTDSLKKEFESEL